MVFSALLSSSADRDRDRALAKATRPTSPAPAAFIFDEADLQPPDAPDAPDLRELNASLEALAAVFPDIQFDVFREMLASFEGESRLALVADALLKNRVQSVKGRWKVVEGPDARPAAHDMFRSEEYKKAVGHLAWHEFKGLSKSTINAVLAESNFAYLEARPTLVQLSSKSWRFALSSLFFRRRLVSSWEAEHDPLVLWKSSGCGSLVPYIKATGDAGLDRELFQALILPLKQRARAEQESKDLALAQSLNEQEAEALDSMFECACCFSDCAFEQMTSCHEEGHTICFGCVQHAINEAVFGQGWQASINPATGTLKCLAPDGNACPGCISTEQMHRAMMAERKGAEVLHRLEQRLAEHSLAASALPLVRCPFCSYAEVDELYVPRGEACLRYRAHNLFTLAAFFVLFLCAMPALLATVLLASLVALVLGTSHSRPGDGLARALRASIARHRRRRRGLRFVCRAAGCGRASCLGCGKAWVDVHVCHESALVALRTQVETAMSLAIKRVCPRCNTSFVKTAGCNKLTCPCGYKMCYVCRRDIGGDGDGPDVGYRHFCQHFRPQPLGGGQQMAPCTECQRCSLWESEDTEKVLREARREAERRWLETEDRELSGAEKVFLETGQGRGAALGLARRWVDRLRKGRWPTLDELCDIVMDNILV
ncbi:hypothetical protein P8C59_006718 [Phyllachora maydis]|uniref:RING-type domain-containing protein n=1 Tax=Phyllachora maydis TaxID=1825666 RepID=A0AAD9MET9_9PEZI|nr:hypothetical protein P8C59_006718 [Phyllachora maydis]